MANHWSPESVFEILADKKARQILVATNVSPRSAQDLVEVCDGCLSAIYRRIDVLCDYDFLHEETKIDPEGHHYRVFEPDFDQLDVELEQASIVVDFSDAEYAERWPRVRNSNQ